MRWYEGVYGWSAGLDVFAPEFKTYWMTFLYTEWVLEIVFFSYIGAFLWKTRTRDMDAVTPREEMYRHFHHLVWLLAYGIAIYWGASFYTEQDGTWHQTVISHTDFSPSHVIQFYMSYPIYIITGWGAFMYARTRLPMFAKGVSLPYLVVVVGPFMILPNVGLNEWGHTFWWMEELFVAPLHLGFVFFGWMALGLMGLLTQIFARLAELAGPALGTAPAPAAWGVWGDFELALLKGKREELVGRMQTNGYMKEKAEQEADSTARVGQWPITKGKGLPEQCSDFTVGAPQRYLVARADERVKVGVPFTLTARISTEDLPSAAGQGGAAVTGEVTGKLKISIYAPGFDSNDGTQRELDVPATGNSSWAPFELVAKKAGVQPIEVLAWKNSAQVGGVTISIGVDAAQPDEGSVQSRLETREPEEGEYTLEVTLESDPNRYRFQLRSDTGENRPPVYSETLEGQNHAPYASTILSLNNQARNANHLSEFAQGEWLKGMGGTLYKSLIPADLRDALWENRDKIKYLNILSATEPMPWELLYVSDRRGNSGRFIADSATVSRWRYGPPPGRQISRQNPNFVLPSGSPTNAQDEVTYARNRLGGGNTIDQLDDLLRLLNAGQFSLLHFASHNVVDPKATGGLYIPFGKAKFDIAFMGNWSTDQFRSQSPLVFMNSCTSGGAAPLYTEMAGWADGFIKAGCGAFIGSLWEIRDTSALAFANKFYDEVIGGKNLGESMRTARNVLRSSDPTYLAYSLYGNPLASFA